MLDEFPDKPKRMHWRTYERLRRTHDIAEERSTIGVDAVCQSVEPSIIPSRPPLT